MKIPVAIARPGHRVRLSKVDPDDTGGLKKDEACERFFDLRAKISQLQEMLYAEHERSLLLVFQALDSGGKDGAVEAVCNGLNPAGLLVHSFKVPTPEELDHDFLWRAHRVVPGKGVIAVWNRSHYEDVIVARVHKLVPKKIWKGRYAQINGFEKYLTQNGTMILKFMLHISKEEQKKRLEARLENRDKRWKFNMADLKERAVWGKHQRAYEDAINECATEYAPWHVVPANHKWARDLAIAEQVFATLEKMDPGYPQLPFDPKSIRID